MVLWIATKEECKYNINVRILYRDKPELHEEERGKKPEPDRKRRVANVWLCKKMKYCEKLIRL